MQTNHFVGSRTEGDEREHGDCEMIETVARARAVSGEIERYALNTDKKAKL